MSAHQANAAISGGISIIKTSCFTQLCALLQQFLFFSFFQQKFEPEGPCPRTHEEDAGHNRRLFLLHTE
jgi:hypothetical protein